MELKEMCEKVECSLDELYEKDFFLFQENLCERCINHRFAVHLENQIFEGYYIDCEYNRSHFAGRSSSKQVSNSNGNFIDILITRRDGKPDSDLACFELKKWNNRKGRAKDRENLKVLTNQQDFAHKFGFYVIYGEKRKDVKVEIYENGQLSSPC